MRTLFFLLALAMLVMTIPCLAADETAKARVYWDPVEGAARYRVYVRVDNMAYGDPFIAVGRTEYIFEHLLFGKRYYFQVQAENATQIGPLSEEVSATMPKQMGLGRVVNVGVDPIEEETP